MIAKGGRMILTVFFGCMEKVSIPSVLIASDQRISGSSNLDEQLAVARQYYGKGVAFRSNAQS